MNLGNQEEMIYQEPLVKNGEDPQQDGRLGAS